MTDKQIFDLWGACLIDPSVLAFGRAIAEEAVRLEREAAAKACEDFGASYDNEWNRKLGVANDLKDACEECAAAIRSRSEDGS